MYFHCSICFNLGYTADKTDLYNKLIKLFGNVGSVEYNSVGKVVDFEILTKYGSLELYGDKELRLCITSENCDELSKLSSLSCVDVSNLQSMMRQFDIIRCSESWRIQLNPIMG